LSEFHVPNLSHTIRKFNRFELKYLVPIKAAEKFKQSLRAYLVPDNHGNSFGCYNLSSLYYDGPDFCFYWEKVDGIKFRRKLRIRHYESSAPLCADTPVFVEIKQRLNRTTQKRRVLLPYREALRLCNERQMPEATSFAQTSQDAAVLDEMAGMLWQYDLRPASVVSYARQALVGTEYDIGLRVTFDTDLSYRASHLQLHEQQSGRPLFPPGWTVVEIKVNERIPYWLTELVAMHNLNLVRVSKYCRSVELAQNLALCAGLSVNQANPIRG
jgi:SPX domain protein involved in polyphosphate accumulation